MKNENHDSVSTTDSLQDFVLANAPSLNMGGEYLNGAWYSIHLHQLVSSIRTNCRVEDTVKLESRGKKIMSKTLKDAVRDLTHSRTIVGIHGFTAEEIMGLTAIYMDSLTISEQLDIIVESNPKALLANVKSSLRGEGRGAYGLMDSRNLLAHDILMGCAKAAFEAIDQALEDVQTERSHDRGVY